MTMTAFVKALAINDSDEPLVLSFPLSFPDNLRKVIEKKEWNNPDMIDIVHQYFLENTNYDFVKIIEVTHDSLKER